MKISVIMASALALLVLPGYAFAAPSIVTSLTASVEDGAGGFEELEGPKGVTAVTVGSSTYALVAAYGDDGVQIVNITDPNNPTPVASMGDGEDGFEELKGARYVTTVTIDSSTYALVSASADNGVQIINITTPSSPSPVAHVSDAAGLALQDPRGIATLTTGSSTYALVASHDGGVQIINITTPSSPAPVTNVHDGSGGFEALSRARGITTVTLDSSTYALVASYDDGVQIINVTNPSEPAPVAAVLNSQSNRLDGATGITTVTVGSSTYALVAAQNDNAVQIINITDPSSPESVAFAQDGSAGFDRLHYPESIATVTFGSSTYAVVASFLDGIQVINITDPSNPSPAASVGSFDTRFGNFALPEAITAVTIDSKTYVLVASYFSNSVPIIGVDLTFGPVLTSATFDEGTGILETVFSDTVDVTPSHLIDPSKMTVGDFGQSVSLAGATLNTEVDSAVISITLTADQGHSVAAMAFPRLDMAASAVRDTSGNPIDSTYRNAVTVIDDAAPEVVSVTLDEGTDTLKITFSDRIDVTPANAVYPGGMTIWGSEQSVSLAGATLNTEADSAVISITLTADQGRSVAALPSPSLEIDRYAVVDTDGNLIESSSGHAISTISVNSVPAVQSIERASPENRTTPSRSLVFAVTFSEAVAGVDAADFALSADGTGTGSVSGLTGSGSRYNVTVIATADGTYNLDIVQNSGIADTAGNPLNGTAPAGADESYTVDSALGLAHAPPIAEAGPPQTVNEGSTVTLAGTATDPDQTDTLTHAWSQTSPTSPAVTFGNSSALSTTFTAPQVAANTTFTFTLSVTDGTATATDTVTVTVLDVPAPNIPPTVNAGADQAVDEGDTVTLTGTATDDDDDPLAYRWTHDSSLAITMANDTSLSTTFTAPAATADTTITFTLTASDGIATASDSMILAIEDVLDTSQPAGAFVTTWQTTQANERITIPVGRATGMYSVDWGDGHMSENVSGNQQHMYVDPGTYTVSISGDFTRIYLGGQQPNADRLQSIDQWGDIKWESMNSAFQGASNVTYRATDAPDLSSVADMSWMFYGASSFNGDISDWDVSEVTGMGAMFHEAHSFNGDLSAWDVSEVTGMGDMFHGATSFNGDLSAWDVSEVTDMGAMFFEAHSFNGDLSAWDVSEVTDMLAMFHDAISFNGDLSAWDVSEVTGMGGMFHGATSFNGDLSAWDVSEVTGMSAMFHEAHSFNGDLSAWDVSEVTDMGAMFLEAHSFNGDLSAWDVSSITNMHNMFRDADSFNQNLGKWYVVLDDTTIDLADTGNTVGSISAQNSELEGQSPTYGLGSDSVSQKFAIGGNNLQVKSGEDYSGGPYGVTITATGTGLFGTNNNRTVDVTVTNTTQSNNPPTAEAGPAQAVNEGSTVTLTGTATDLDHADTLTHAWSQASPASPAATFGNSSALSTTFTAPQVAATTAFTFTLNATDGTVYVHDTVTVTVRDVPAPDIADVTSITPDGLYHPGQTVDVRINFTRPVNLEAFTIQDGGRDAAGGTFTRMDRPSGLATAKIGDSYYALVSTIYDDGVQIIDITDPASPVAVAAIADGTNYPNLAAGYAITTVQMGNLHYALVASDYDHGVQIVNITDPARPSPVAAFNDGVTYTELQGAYSITTVQIGDSYYALVAGSDDDGIQIIDITDPASPAPAAALQKSQTYPALRSPKSVTTTQIGDSHYALATSSRINAIQIIDITDPARPSPVAALTDGQAYPELGGAYSVTTTQIGDSHYALVAAASDDGVQIVNITDPARPSPVAALTDGQAYPELDGATSITTAQIGDSHYALVASIHDDGVQIIDITDPARPSPVAALTDGTAYPELGGARTVITTQIGDSHYALVAGVADKGVQMIDITDPADPSNPLLPYVELDLAGDRRATYAGQAHGGHALVFEYVVKNGDQTGDLAYSGTDALVLGHSGLTDTGGSSDLSNITLPEPGAPHSLSHNKQIDLRAWPNNPPTADAGTAQAVQGGDTVTLNGTASDQDGDRLAYSWSHDSALDISLANAGSLSPAFTAPQVSANTTVTFTLTADDGTDAHSDTVTVTILDVPASDTQTAISEQISSVVLEPEEPRGTRDIGRMILNSTRPGTIDASWDAPVEAPVDYRISWAKAGEPYLTWTDLSGNAFPTGPSRTIADLEEGETYKVMVRARYGGSSGDWSGEITVTVAGSANNPPTADAGTAQAVQEGDTVTLNGTASDQDGDQLTYSWSHDSALDISLANADSLSPAFTAPQVSANTTVTFTLTADDGTDTHSDTVTVTILDVPVVGTPNRGSDQNTTAVLNPDGPLGPRDIGRITLTSAQPGTIQASWEAPSETPADYRISWAKAGEPYLTWTDLSGNAFPTGPSRTIADLEEGETYKVMVRARYGGSSGDWSGEITVTVARTV